MTPKKAPKPKKPYLGIIIAKYPTAADKNTVIKTIIQKRKVFVKLNI
jgi:hypothetical protein